MKKCLRVPVIVLAFGAGMVNGINAADIKRWTDKDGIPNYSDQVPPEDADKRRSVLSPQGQEKAVIEPPKSPEQLAREDQLRRLREQQERMLRDQREQDAALRKTYRNVEEMYQALRAKLETLDGFLRLTEANRLRQKELLAEQERAAAGQERSGQAISQKQREVIDATRRQIANYDEKLLALQAEKLTISDRFEKDIARFRVLQQQSIASHPDYRSRSLASPTGLDAQEEISVIACNVGRFCDQAWRLAREYVLKTAGGSLLVDTDKVLQTPYPTDDREFGLTVVRLPGKREQMLFLDVSCRASSIGETVCASPRVRQIRSSFKTYIENGLAGSPASNSP